MNENSVIHIFKPCLNLYPLPFFYSNKTAFKEPCDQHWSEDSQSGRPFTRARGVLKALVMSARTERLGTPGPGELK